MVNFCFQSNNSNIPREKLAIYEYASKNKIPIIYSENALAGHIPIGSVEFCEQLPFISNIPKIFYPPFLSKFRFRDIRWIHTLGQTLKDDAFVKRADVWKDEHSSQVKEKGEYLPAGTYYLSEVVDFTQEWRYYVLNGEVITTGWYAGNDDDEPAPELDIFPDWYSGAVDFGRLSTGKMALVEAHAPFACGWYGERSDNLRYGHWQYHALENYLGKNKSYRSV